MKIYLILTSCLIILNANVVLAESGIALCTRLEKLHNLQAAYTACLEAAESGNSEAYTKVGSMLSSGKGVSKNEEKAIYWFKKALDQENSVAKPADVESQLKTNKVAVWGHSESNERVKITSINIDKTKYIRFDNYEIEPEEDNQFYIKLGPFSKRKTAYKLSDKLKKYNIYSYIFNDNNDHYLWFGNYTKKEDAVNAANKLVIKKVFEKYQILAPDQYLKYYESNKPNRPDSTRLTGEVKKMEIFLNSDEFRQIFTKILKKYQTANFNFNDVDPEYFYSKCGNTLDNYNIQCDMTFPGPWYSGQMVPQRYVHVMEIMTKEVAYSFSKNFQGSFKIFSWYKNDSIPVCHYWYSDTFDRFDFKYYWSGF